MSTRPGRCFSGLTVGCARCHDHKFDPIPQRDYYRMQAIFVPAEKTRVFLQYDPARGYDLAENLRHAKLREIGDQFEAILTAVPEEAVGREAAPNCPPRCATRSRPMKRSALPRSARSVEENRRKITPHARRGSSRPDAEHEAALHKIEVQLVTMFPASKPDRLRRASTISAARRRKRSCRRARVKPPKRSAPGFLTRARRRRNSRAADRCHSTGAARRSPTGSPAPQIRCPRA